ncbi:MAG: transposase [Bacteroidales bacterium]|nr:transposase [Bacteroidales bacterium]
MSTSLIYHAFGVHGYQYVRTFYKKGKIFFVIQTHPSQIRCPECDSRRVIRKGTQTRHLKTLPIGKKQVVLVTIIQRIRCLECQCVKQVKLGLADPKKSYTLAFARYVLVSHQVNKVG